jgi:hypothetical protein
MPYACVHTVKRFPGEILRQFRGISAYQPAGYPEIGPQPVAVSYLIDAPTADRPDFSLLVLPNSVHSGNHSRTRLTVA